MGSLVFFMVTALILNIQRVKTDRSSGPFNVLLKRIDQCEDNGTGDLQAGTKISNKGNGIKTFTGNITFLVPWDQELQMDADIQILHNGQYQSNFLRQRFKNCEHAMKILNGTFTSLFAAAGYNFTKCPLPARNYAIKDWVLDAWLDATPTFIYGSYKTLLKWTRKGKLVGCILIYDDVVPK